MLESVMWPAVIIGGLGLVFGALLAVAARFFATEADPRIDSIRNFLPGANCGACGYPGCDGMANAIVKEQAPINSCPVANAEALKAIAAVMGEEVTGFKRLAAVVRCRSNSENVHIKYVYQGLPDCAAAATVAGGYKMCRFSCLGFGNCAKVCPADAIRVEDGIAVVNQMKCIACGKCAAACPRGVISMLPLDAPSIVMCRSYNRGKEVRESCEAGCISCGLCVKACEIGAIQMVNNLPIIDYDVCTGCMACVNKCPRKCIRINR